MDDNLRSVPTRSACQAVKYALQQMAVASTCGSTAVKLSADTGSTNTVVVNH